MNKNNDKKPTLMNRIEKIVEHFLWNFRFVIMLGVIGLLLGSAVIFILGITETFSMIKLFISQLIEHGNLSEKTYHDIIIKTITTIDDFLLGTVLLIFGLGTYDLFISRLDPAEEQENVRPHWLRFNSLDELKNTLGKVVLMIMIVNFLKYVVELEFKDPIQVLYLGVSIAFIGLALKLSHGKDIDHTTMQKLNPLKKKKD